MSCQATIQQGPQKGTLCGAAAAPSLYCKKHVRQAVVEKAATEGIRYCDIARGCFTVLESHQSKCQHCLQKARIRDRRRHDKKRQDDTLCLDCAGPLTPETRAVGKHGKELRRCRPCHEKLIAVESARPPRERNYKAEAFHNKHVAWNHYVRGAKKRGLDFALEKTAFNELIALPCFYCGHYVAGEINGVDRVDNALGYTNENVVACCQTCNLAKKAQHPCEFIDKMRAIHEYVTAGEAIGSEVVERWKATYISKGIPKYSVYAKGATTRNLEFKLTEVEFADRIGQPCYLCGISSDTNGIDRFDNGRGYTTENSRPCCGHCNLMKCDLPYEVLVGAAGRIAAKHAELTAFFGGLKIVGGRRRERGGSLIVAETEGRIYVPLNEVVDPGAAVAADIRGLLDVATAKPQPPKQWKTRQIYDAVVAGREATYKAYCEEIGSAVPDDTWSEFVRAVREGDSASGKSVICDFVRKLRAGRHNLRCYERNAGIVDRADRQRWPAGTIVRAFLDGKLAIYRAFLEKEGESSYPGWQERWPTFVADLEAARGDEEALKGVCRRFMSSGRARRWRRKE